MGIHAQLIGGILGFLFISCDIGIQNFATKDNLLEAFQNQCGKKQTVDAYKKAC